MSTTIKAPTGDPLFKHQQVEVERFRAVGRHLIAGEMGTGKTRTAAAIAVDLHHGASRFVVVLAPAFLLGAWDDEMRLWKVPASLHSWGKIPAPDEFPEDLEIFLIVDEAHYAASMRAKRTKGFLALAKRASEVLCLTGTPTVNGKPRELFPMLVALRHPVAEDRQEFEVRYCAGHWQVMGPGRYQNGRLSWKCKVCGQGNCTVRHAMNKKPLKCDHCGGSREAMRIFWNAEGASNLEEFRKEIEPYFTRWLKAECTDLPPKTRKVIPITPTAAQLASFKRSVQMAKEIFASKADETSGQLSAEAMILTSAMRVQSSLHKIPHAIEYAQNLIDEGQPVVIFTSFVETAKAVADAFNTKAITGEMDVHTRRTLVEEFQAGARMAFVSTIKAGGVGITLTASSQVIMIDRAWALPETEQAEDRVHRIGQHWPVTSHWITMLPIDERVDAVAAAKGEQAAAIFNRGGQGRVGYKAAAAVEVLRGLFEDSF